MLKIALCDDEPVTLDLLKNEIDALLQAQNLEYQIASYASGLSLLQDFSAKGFDVLFLDIDMPDVSGFQVAEALQDSTSQCRVVFVTSKRNLMHQSFDYQPFHFICKGDSSDPFPDLKRILSKLLRFYRQNYLLQVHDAIRGVFVLPIKDIYYIKSTGHYLYYHQKSPTREPLRERGQIREKARELSQYDFIRIHKQYLVNLYHILHFDHVGHKIILTNQEELPLSQKEKEAAVGRYLQFRRR